MCTYMEEFASKYLPDKIKFGVEILKVEHHEQGSPPGQKWAVTVEEVLTKAHTTIQYDKVILCTGVCLSYHSFGRFTYFM